jgi:hypothetical protein
MLFQVNIEYISKGKNNMQKRKKLKALFNNYKCEIIEDVVEVGFMLYIYEGEKCIYDMNQDTIEFCQEDAFEEFGIPNFDKIKINNYQIFNKPSNSIISKITPGIFISEKLKKILKKEIITGVNFEKIST